jgi:UDP-N-acetylglucosamine diphosphorylase/glucosamine-1-phosphate N-acetyltransferase
MSPAVLFEPQNLSTYGPMTLLRSVGELRYGVYSNIERARKVLPQHDLGLWLRPLLRDGHAQRYPEMKINQDAPAGTLFLNAGFPAWVFPASIAELDQHDSGVVIKDGCIVAARHDKPLAFGTSFSNELLKLQQIECDVETCTHHPHWIWDYLNLILPALEFDLQIWKENNNILSRLPENSSSVDERNIYIHNTAQLSRYIHLDSSQGPIIIDADVKISPFASLEGPLYIGKRSTIKQGASLKNSVVGRICNLGGEIKSSIIHPYTNKSHAGFLGDSILGSWINLGAGTNTSNLKNNYGEIRVSWDGNNYDTHRQFLGSIIGDHSKTAIGVRLNTGTVIGPFSNVIHADFPPRSIPSFSWGNGTHEFDKAMETARRVLKRRSLELSKVDLALFKTLSEDHASLLHY